jgi:hypothetical protein
MHKSHCENGKAHFRNKPEDLPGQNLFKAFGMKGDGVSTSVIYSICFIPIG